MLITAVNFWQDQGSKNKKISHSGDKCMMESIHKSKTISIEDARKGSKNIPYDAAEQQAILYCFTFATPAKPGMATWSNIWKMLMQQRILYLMPMQCWWTGKSTTGFQNGLEAEVMVSLWPRKRAKEWVMNTMLCSERRISYAGTVCIVDMAQRTGSVQTMIQARPKKWEAH